MKAQVFTQEEIWNATKHQVVRSKKTYTRKNKHKVKY